MVVMKIGNNAKAICLKSVAVARHVNETSYFLERNE